MSNLKIEFKDTEIGRIPKDWKVVKLSDVVIKEKHAIVDGPFGSQMKVAEFVDKGIPVIEMEHLKSGKLTPKRFITEEKFQEVKRSSVKSYDLIISKTGTLGVVIIVPNNIKVALITSRLAKISLDQKKIDILFGYYFLNYMRLRKYWDMVGSGSTMKVLTIKKIANLPIPLPPLPEQQKIAEILGTVDEAIQKVDEAIEKTERLKKGLMQELLTKGIPISRQYTVDGRQKGKISRQQTVDSRLGKEKREFKDTEIGRIPKDWEVATLDEIINIHDNKRIPLSEMERANKKGVYPYCGANGVIDYIDDYIFQSEYILLAEDGGAYGKFESSCYLMNGKFWVNNHAHILQVKKNKGMSKFYMSILNFLNLNQYLVGSTRKKLNQNDMKRIKIPLLALSEQQRIVEILSSIDEKLKNLLNGKGKYERIKKGLMNDLLTGKRRVKV